MSTRPRNTELGGHADEKFPHLEKAHNFPELPNVVNEDGMAIRLTPEEVDILLQQNPPDITSPEEKRLESVLFLTLLHPGGELIIDDAGIYVKEALRLNTEQWDKCRADLGGDNPLIDWWSVSDDPDDAVAVCADIDNIIASPPKAYLSDRVLELAHEINGDLEYWKETVKLQKIATEIADDSTKKIELTNELSDERDDNESEEIIDALDDAEEVPESLVTKIAVRPNNLSNKRLTFNFSIGNTWVHTVLNTKDYAALSLRHRLFLAIGSVSDVKQPEDKANARLNRIVNKGASEESFLSEEQVAEVIRELIDSGQVVSSPDGFRLSLTVADEVKSIKRKTSKNKEKEAELKKKSKEVDLIEPSLVDAISQDTWINEKIEARAYTAYVLAALELAGGRITDDFPNTRMSELIDDSERSTSVNFDRAIDDLASKGYVTRNRLDRKEQTVYLNRLGIKAIAGYKAAWLAGH